MFRFGILGASHFAVSKMIPAMQAGGDTPVVAIASRDGTKAAEAARQLGIPKTYASYEELLADPEIDGVYIPLPNHLHVPWAERAAAAGKHVLIEKPVALGAAEARRLLAARDRHHVVICEAAMVRVHPRWLAARELVRKGKIGELGAFVGTFGYAVAARENVRFDAGMGGGVLLDTGFYPVTMSRFCFDDEPTTVAARMEQDPDSGVDVMTSARAALPARPRDLHLQHAAGAPATRADPGQQGAHRSAARLEPRLRPPVRAGAGDERPPGGHGRRADRVSGRQPVHDPGPAVRARGGHGRPRADPPRRFDPEHGRARRAPPVRHQRTLGNDLPRNSRTVALRATAASGRRVRGACPC